MTDHKNIFNEQSYVTQEERLSLMGQKPFCLWFTGLSGSGKSTLSKALERELVKRHKKCLLLDGDNLRAGLNNNLGFNAEDRSENIRRSAEAAKLLCSAGIVTLAALISPLQKDREAARKILMPFPFIEIHVATSLILCEKRDTKGLYAKARRGEILNFTGISSPYEKPLKPEIRLDTGDHSVQESVQIIIDFIEQAKLLS